MYTPIRAAGAGTVLFAGPNPYDPFPKAWIVIIAHSQNLVTWYGHVDNSARPPRVRAGEQVNKGEIIAYNGLTGRTTGPHLHWMVELNDDFRNPRLFV
jgi:murein DD-endopeptidase MepM/ murein hydrolase activator NlpD